MNEILVNNHNYVATKIILLSDNFIFLQKNEENELLREDKQ